MESKSFKKFKIVKAKVTEVDFNRFVRLANELGCTVADLIRNRTLLPDKLYLNTSKLLIQLSAISNSMKNLEEKLDIPNTSLSIHQEQQVHSFIFKEYLLLIGRLETVLKKLYASIDTKPRTS